jgi:uncharacterized protein YeaC (DUF1315 family)
VNDDELGTAIEVGRWFGGVELQAGTAASSQENE